MDSGNDHIGVDDGSNNLPMERLVNDTTTSNNRSHRSGVTFLAGPVVRHSRKRKISVDEKSEVIAAKKARLLQKLKQISDDLELGLSSQFTESPNFIENGEMQSYQVTGLNWMIALYENDLSGILADEMGKTLQTISLIGYLQLVRKVNGRFLIVVPSATITNWESKFQHWCPSLSVVSLYGAENVRQQVINSVLNVRPFDWDVCLTTYETCKLKYSRKFFSSMRWHHIILDEGTRIKNEKTVLSQTIRKFKAEFRLLMTGSPLNNNLHELRDFLTFLMPSDFISSIEKSVVNDLNTILKPLVLRRLKSEVEDIKPYKTINVLVKITHLQREWYREILMKHIEVATGDGDVEIKFAQLKAMFSKLRKCTNHPYLFDGAEQGPPFIDGDHIVNNSGKMIALDMLLAKLKQQGSRVLILSQFTRVLDIIQDYLDTNTEYQFCRLDGYVNTMERTNRIAEFQDPQSGKFVFLMSTRCGRWNINLTAADSVIIYDSDWNSQMDLQAIARVHRIGQTKPVRVFRLIAMDTVDEKMMEGIDVKSRLSDDVIESNPTSRSVVSTKLLLDAVRFGADSILSNDSSYDGAERDRLVKKNSQKLVDTIFEYL